MRVPQAYMRNPLVQLTPHLTHHSVPTTDTAFPPEYVRELNESQFQARIACRQGLSRDLMPLIKIFAKRKPTREAAKIYACMMIPPGGA